MKARIISRLLFSASTICWTLPAAAGAHQPAAADMNQGSRASSEEEQAIVVTARKREESVEDIPLSITVIDGRELERTGVEDFQDYAVRVPNLAFAYTNSLGGAAQSIALRGIFGAGTTGLYLDETPLAASVDPRVLDLERIEVLRGPQGTLYGARSMGGTVRLITRRPHLGDVQGFGRVMGSSTDHGGLNGSIDGSVNVPVAPGMFALRAAGFYDEEAGFYDRVAAPDAPVDFGTNENVDSLTRYGGMIGGRLQTPNGDFNLLPRAIFQVTTTDGRRLADVRAGNLEHVRLFDIDERGRDAWQLYSLTGEYVAPFGTFVSSTSQFDRQIRDSEDFSELVVALIGLPPTPSIIRASIGSGTFAQEFRFSSEPLGPVQFTTGVFYQRSSSKLRFPPTPVAGFSDDIFSQDLRTVVTEKAVFGEATWEIIPRLNLTGGARAFDNEVDFAGSQQGALVAPDTFAGVQRERGINPKVSVQYMMDNAQVYATAARGFRVGGVNSFSNLLCAEDLAALGLTPERAQTFDSDSVWSYELGVKGHSIDRRLELSGAVFRVDWSGVQQVAPLNTCGFFVTVNAGKARSEGAELEGRLRLTDQLGLGFGVGYTDARITDPGPFGVFTTGQRIQQVPRWSGTANLDYRFEISGLPTFARIDYSFVGESFSGNNSATNPRRRPSYSLLNVRTGVELGQIEITVFAENLFNEIANLSDSPPLAIELPGRPRIYTNRPRTLGLEARVRF